jgi:hypothetical protein
MIDELEQNNSKAVKLAVLAKTDREIPNSYCDWLIGNIHVWEAFEQETFNVIAKGFKHYSARTIIHYLRHYSEIGEQCSKFKIKNGHSPYLARLFALIHPEHKEIFSYHTVVVADKENENEN